MVQHVGASPALLASTAGSPDPHTHLISYLQVASTDKICTVCRLKIKRFYSFRVMCLKSDARIRQASIGNDVSVVRPEMDDPVRSYKRQKRMEPAIIFDLQVNKNRIFVKVFYKKKEILMLHCDAVS